MSFSALGRICAASSVIAPNKSSTVLTQTITPARQSFVANAVRNRVSYGIDDRNSNARWLVATSSVPAHDVRDVSYALRRLGKEVVRVNYMNGGHGGANATPSGSTAKANEN